MKCEKWDKFKRRQGLRRKVQGRKIRGKDLSQQAGTVKEVRGREPRATPKRSSYSNFCVYLLFLISFMFVMQLEMRFTL